MLAGLFLSKFDRLGVKKLGFDSFAEWLRRQSWDEASVVHRARGSVYAIRFIRLSSPSTLLSGPSRGTQGPCSAGEHRKRSTSGEEAGWPRGMSITSMTKRGTCWTGRGAFLMLS